MLSRPQKQSMSELKLRRLTEHNQRLREDLERPRIRVSDATLFDFAKRLAIISCHRFGDHSARAKIPTPHKRPVPVAVQWSERSTSTTEKRRNGRHKI
ncbi:hypothetical protein KEM48_001247 [Puccinia striiformis f. sp. tritici PST-130]|nr:hypothetical protein KEM48_001247 [Puccinia striiformis f. sp. tritici PST-130]